MGVECLLDLLMLFKREKIAGIFTEDGSRIVILIHVILFVFQQMIDDVGLGTVANLLGMFIFFLVIAYHYVTADPKYEGN
ncbi:hypothetical protein DVH24_024121 [Malus domestica]|uniref:Dolichyl-diphosphooligosaccharide--protein glycosyltransferase subunit 4 n=1 Tax=Malus domestica TaxID=3750 RepID=A0A498JHZ9_MALDO|nr:hypothetical protein DVH24_024121 [Malus domestica]